MTKEHDEAREKIIDQKTLLSRAKRKEKNGKKIFIFESFFTIGRDFYAAG
jgi:hypothetical protein